MTCRICVGRYHTRPIPDLLVRVGGSLAQLVEQLAFNQLVARSNRARPTTFFQSFLNGFSIVVNPSIDRLCCMSSERTVSQPDASAEAIIILSNTES